jgi:hypothetical protein
MKNRDIEDDCLSLDNVKAKLQEASPHGSRPYSNAEKHLLVSFVLTDAIKLIRNAATEDYHEHEAEFHVIYITQDTDDFEPIDLEVREAFAKDPTTIRTTVCYAVDEISISNIIFTVMYLKSWVSLYLEATLNGSGDIT